MFLKVMFTSGDSTFIDAVDCAVNFTFLISDNSDNLYEEETCIPIDPLSM